MNIDEQPNIDEQFQHESYDPNDPQHPYNYGQMQAILWESMRSPFDSMVDIFDPTQNPIHGFGSMPSEENQQYPDSNTW